MDKFELLGFLLQDLRDNHGPDEEDIGAAILRETTKIYSLVIQHGYLTREMFDLSGIDDPRSHYSVPSRYAQYQTTNYPITFVTFANGLADWLLGKDERERLEVIDLIAMIKECSWLRIKIAQQRPAQAVLPKSNQLPPGLAGPARRCRSAAQPETAKNPGLRNAGR